MNATLSAFRLDGKNALVTGAARGIGAAIAMALAESGARVVLSDVLEGELESTAAAIDASGAGVRTVHHDVTVESQWAAAVALLEREFGPMDILVNNAGIETAALLSTCELGDFLRVMDVNVTGVFLGMKHAVRAMSPGGSSGRGGSIINLSSVAGMIGTTGHIAYHTSKGAVRVMSKAGAIECAQLGTGIRVNSVHPAIIATDMGENFVRHFVELGLVPDFETGQAALKAAHPMGRFGEPTDVACAVVYLAAPASKWVTGTELVVDGGYTAA